MELKVFLTFIAHYSKCGVLIEDEEIAKLNSVAQSKIYFQLLMNRVCYSLQGHSVGQLVNGHLRK